MTILRARILLTLAFVAVASARTCPLCPHGERPRNGNAVLFADGTDTVTCKEVEQDIFANADGSCDDFFTYAIQVVCRCPRVKAGSCPGICNTGYILDQPDLGTPFLGLTCSVVDQLLRGTPGVTNCDSEFANSGIKEFCICKVNVKPSQNMGSGESNPGTGMMGMSGGRNLRLSGLEEHFPPRASRGLAM